MKKFAFTLQAVYEYKQTVEKTQKAELAAAQAELRRLYEIERLLNEAYERNRASQAEVLRRPGPEMPAELERHDAYFRYLRDAKAELHKKIQQAELFKEQCQERLIITMKEIKTYGKLRDEQYAEYLQEVKAEEEKDIGDLVSFSIISG